MSVGTNDCCSDEAIARALQAEINAEVDEEERIAATRERSPFEATPPKRKVTAVKYRQNTTKAADNAPWKKASLTANTATNGGVSKQASSFREAEDEALAKQMVQNDIERIRPSTDLVTDEFILQAQQLALSNGASETDVNSLMAPPAWHPVDPAGLDNQNLMSDPFEFSLHNEHMPSLPTSFNRNFSDPPLSPVFGMMSNGGMNSAFEASKRLYERFQPATVAADTVQADGPVVHPRIVMCTSPPISPSPSTTNAPYSLETVRRLHYVVDSSVMPPPEYLEWSGCTRTNGATSDLSSSARLLSGKRNGSGSRSDSNDPKASNALYQKMYDVHRESALRIREAALIVQRGSVGKHPAASAVQRQRADRMRDQAVEEDIKAGWAIVYYNNRTRKADEVDLHGLHQADLPHVLPHIIRQKHEQLKPGTRLALITGVGNNSRTRKCVLRSRVMQFFELNNIRTEEALNGGILYVAMPNVLPKLDAAVFFGNYGDE